MANQYYELLAAYEYDLIRPRSMLLDFYAFGLGDHMQFQIVLRHLERYRPQFTIGVVGRIGAYKCFEGFAAQHYQRVHPFTWIGEYDETIAITFPSFDEGRYILDCPNTKAARSLMYDFQITPDPELFRYSFEIRPEDQAQADKYIKEELPQGKPFHLLHWQGISKPEEKDLTLEEAKNICETIIENGATPVVLDWGRGSESFVDNKRIFCPARGHWLWKDQIQPNCGIVAGLINRAEAMVGIDSGPEHIAGAFDLPVSIVWRNHHPLFCYDLASNVTHLVPTENQYMIPLELDDYFHNNYNVVYY